MIYVKARAYVRRGPHEGRAIPFSARAMGLVLQAMTPSISYWSITVIMLRIPTVILELDLCGTLKCVASLTKIVQRGALFGYEMRHRWGEENGCGARPA